MKFRSNATTTATKNANKFSLKNQALLLAFAAAFSTGAHAADDKELSQIREEIKQMRTAYESRMQALEQRLVEAQAKNEKLQAQVDNKLSNPATTAANTSSKAKGKAGMSNEFNPAIALNLNGTLANLSQDPESYKIQGFMPTGGEIGPGQRGFSLGESELSFMATIDPHFSGQLTFALAPEGGAEVEEAFVETRDLSNGIKIKAGRFLSGIGYINQQHAHAWDFVDAPLAYQAFFGGQYKREGAQVKWLAPIDRFLEIGMEVGNGGSFPGTPRNKNGFADSAVFAHVGDDIGDSASWRLGLSWLRNKAQARTYQDVDGVSGLDVENSFAGRSRTVVLDGIFKWAPNGNSKQTNLKLMGEYFQRQTDGTLSHTTADTGSQVGSYSSRQTGWYAQGVYQFMPQWRVGLRHERLSSGNHNIGPGRKWHFNRRQLPTAGPATRHAKPA